MSLRGIDFALWDIDLAVLYVILSFWDIIRRIIGNMKIS